MADINDPTFWIPVLVSVVAVVPLYLDLWNRRRESRIEMELEKFHTEPSEAGDSFWSIRILHPNRLIERCRILCNEVPLPWWDKKEPYYERKIVQGGGGVVRVPRSVATEDESEVVVMDGDRVLRRRKFEELLFTSP